MLDLLNEMCIYGNTTWYSMCSRVKMWSPDVWTKGRNEAWECGDEIHLLFQYRCILLACFCFISSCSVVLLIWRRTNSITTIGRWRLITGRWKHSGSVFSSEQFYNQEWFLFCMDCFFVILFLFDYVKINEITWAYLSFCLVLMCLL